MFDIMYVIFHFPCDMLYSNCIFIIYRTGSGQHMYALSELNALMHKDFSSRVLVIFIIF